jgi:hypothetical protein
MSSTKAFEKLVNDTLQPQAPPLAEEIAAHLRRCYDAVKAAFPNRIWDGHNSWAREGAIFRNIVRGIIDGDGNLREDLVLKIAKEQADAIVIVWAAKIIGKLESIENGEVLRLDGYAYNIVGTRAGKKIQIVQNMKHSTSSKGTPFMQFPALIYVDGKKVSEKLYKEMFV